MEPGRLWWSKILNSALPSQNFRSDTQPEHQDPVSHTAVNVVVLIMKSDYEGL